MPFIVCSHGSHSTPRHPPLGIISLPLMIANLENGGGGAKMPIFQGYNKKKRHDGMFFGKRIIKVWHRVGAQ